MTTPDAPRRLALADPPYLGRAARWYGTGRGYGRPPSGGRAYATPAPHPDAADYDDPETHEELLLTLMAEYDGFALAGCQESLPLYLRVMEEQQVPWHLGAWCRPSSLPGGGRVHRSWEPVLFRVPDSRRRRGATPQVRDYLVASVRPDGFVGSKPPAWTRWCLLMLGHQPEDEVVDLFPGSGAVGAAVETPLPLVGEMTG